MGSFEERMIQNELARYSASERQEIARTRASLEEWARRFKLLRDIAISVADIVQVMRGILDTWKGR